MKEQLERLIQQVQETQLVERLLDERTLHKQVKICEEAKQTASFVAFMQCYDEIRSKSEFEGKSVVTDEWIECTADNAVAIAIILIIGGLDDTDLFDDYDMFIDALSEVDDELAEVAMDIADFLEVDLFTNHTLEELLEQFF